MVFHSVDVTAVASRLSADDVYPLDKACFHQICVYAHIFRGGRAADGYAMIRKNLDKGGCDFVRRLNRVLYCAVCFLSRAPSFPAPSNKPARLEPDALSVV